MAITNFVPTVWSEALNKSLDQAYIGVAHCNREYEGEIREKGNKVKICGLNNIAVRDYSKNANMQIAEVLSDFSTDLLIRYAKYFHFQIDDVDRAQASPQLMDIALKNAAAALAAEADRIVYTTCSQTENIHSAAANVDTIIHEILAARTLLYEINGTDCPDVVLEVSPQIGAMITEAKINTLSNNTDMMETGCIGSIAGCKIFVSPYIMIGEDDDCNPVHQCILRSTRAVAFAEQLSEIQAYRPELRFSDAVKGLHLYGCEIVRPKEIVGLHLAMLPQA